jgi:hypothetical protein
MLLTPSTIMQTKEQDLMTFAPHTPAALTSLQRPAERVLGQFACDADGRPMPEDRKWLPLRLFG